MKKAKDTRIRLLETAIELVSLSNYDGVGVAEICKQAGVTKGSFYHYFESKADLYYAASQHHWNEIKAELDDILSPAHEPLEQLELFIEKIATGRQSECSPDSEPIIGCPFFTSSSQAGSDEAKVQQASTEMSEKAVKYNAALVRSLKGGGYLAEDVDPLQTGRMIHHYIHGILTYARIHNSLEAVVADLRDAFYRLLTVKHQYRKVEKSAIAALSAP